MKYICVTSMNQPYYNKIGKYMIKSWLKYWNNDFKLFLYLEDCKIDFKDERLVIIDWNNTCRNEWKNFCKRSTNLRSHDFAKKGMATIHAWQNIKADRIIWLDADILFFDYMSNDILERSLENCMIGLFESTYRITPPTKFSAESGFIIVDTTHDCFKPFLEEYKNLYNSKSQPDTVAHWWDNQVLMAAANNFRDYVNNLTRYKLKKTQTPLNSCWLGKYMKHYKAGNKLKVKIDSLSF